mmetsp:Transcript_41086/g.104109  ORF Transcript_41086/g.104109 Transcript_41086/m.104109 type:complete len:322 (-) Transcript_41086:297-1262(-)
MPGRQCYVAEGFATAADGGQLAWRLSRPSDDTGRCGAPLVLLNGLANDDSQWGAYFAAWEDARRAFLYWDYRGHGRSPPAARPQDITISSQASDLQAVLAAAEAQEPSVDLSSFVLVAYSLGAQVALEYCSQLSAAGSEGRQVLGLISVLGTSQPPLTALFGRRTGIMRSAISGLPRAIARAAAALIVSLPRVSYWVMVHAGLGEAGVDYPTALSWAQHIAALDVESVRAFLLAAESHRLDDANLAKLRSPLLIIDGGADLFAPRAHADRMLAALPNAHMAHMALASHMGLAGHAPIVLALIRAFLRDQGLDAPPRVSAIE